MSARKKIVIAEDYRILREGLVAILGARDDFEVVAEAADGLETLRSVRKELPDLLMLDLSMPLMNGISVIRELREQFPELKILVLTMHESDQYVLETFKMGVNGYCTKDISRGELLIAIDSILDGKAYISPGIADIVMEGYLSKEKCTTAKSGWETITLREKEVLKLLAEGFGNKEMAALLHISVKTIEKHRASLMKKLELRNVAALTACAIEYGLVQDTRRNKS